LGGERKMTGFKKGQHKDMPMPFGKHKDKLVCDLEDSYIFWLLDQDFVHKDYPELTEQLRIENKYRNTYRKE
jgi:uncharacterized protein (DUF3820 family)